MLREERLLKEAQKRYNYLVYEWAGAQRDGGPEPPLEIKEEVFNLTILIFEYKTTIKHIRAYYKKG